MSKQISAKELAEIVTKLLTDPEGAGELSGHESYQAFMTDIAQVVCNHCGGEIHHPASDLDDIWYIGIHGNDSLPSAFGGIWREYDKEGELFEPDTAADLEMKHGYQHREWPRADWQYDVANGDTKLGYWDWVAHNIESESNEDDEAKQEREKSHKRNIFSEALGAKFISISDPDFIGGLEEIRVRRDLVAQEILGAYPSDTVITREMYDTDAVFAECLNWMHRHFEFPAWEGRTVCQFQMKHGFPGEPLCLNVMQYSTRHPNKEGVHAGKITLQDLWDATPLGESGWLLSSGYELWFHQNSTL